MSWLALTSIAYFLMALEVILNKFLLASKKVTHPAIYAFYSGILSQFALLFFPFGFHWLPAYDIAISFISGTLFIYGILFLYFAILENEASRVTPAVGAVIPITTYFLSVFLLQESLTPHQLLGVFILILGGLVISVNLKKENKKRFFSGFRESILAGILLATSFTSFKYIYEGESFINVFIWTRLGLLIGSVSLLFFWPKIIWKSLVRFKKPVRDDYHSGLLFVLVKILGGAGSIILNYAISIGSVTLVNALVSLEYVFVFLLSFIFAHWLPKIFQEKKNFTNIFQKGLAIIIIAIGVALVSTY